MTGHRIFPLAPTSGLIRAITLVLLPIPAVLVIAGAVLGRPSELFGAALFAVGIYALVWFWYRPSWFEITPDALRIVWPLRKRELPRAGITGSLILDAQAFSARFGTGLRIGAGGLWGGFGMLWTTRGGLIDFYVSRSDRFVLIEQREGRALLLTPDEPEEFVASLQPPPS